MRIISRVEKVIVRILERILEYIKVFQGTLRMSVECANEYNKQRV